MEISTETSEEASRDKTVMIVEVTNASMRVIRSSGVYANLSGHEVDYIAFLSFQGAFLAPVLSIQHRVPLNKIYRDVLSKSKTSLYRIGPLKAFSLRRNTKVPRGKKRITTLDKLMSVSETRELFRSRRD